MVLPMLILLEPHTSSLIPNLMANPFIPRVRHDVRIVPGSRRDVSQFRQIRQLHIFCQFS